MRRAILASTYFLFAIPSVAWSSVLSQPDFLTSLMASPVPVALGILYIILGVVSTAQMRVLRGMGMGLLGVLLVNAEEISRYILEASARPVEVPDTDLFIPFLLALPLLGLGLFWVRRLMHSPQERQDRPIFASDSNIPPVESIAIPSVNEIAPEPISLEPAVPAPESEQKPRRGVRKVIVD